MHDQPSLYFDTFTVSYLIVVALLICKEAVIMHT